MKKDLVIGIDASTTSCKVIVWDLFGNKIATGKEEIPLLKPKSGWHEQVAEDWWRGLRKSLRIAIQNIDQERLAGLCICPQRETFVPVDRSGKPSRNALSWMDTRAGSLIPDLEQNIGSQRFHAITGKPISGNLTVLKIAWLRKNEPELFKGTIKFLDVASYLNYRLTGDFATGEGIADPTGLYDMRRGDWSTDVLRYLGIKHDQLPATYPAGTVFGAVSAVAARECGITEGLPVIAGLGDGQAGGLGVNITRLGECYLSLGTSVVSGTFTTEFVTDKAFRTMYAGIPGSYSLETVILAGTYTVDWFLTNFAGRRSIDQIEVEICDLPPGSDGLILVPYWNSALNPYWDPKASGITLGWRGHHSPAHLYRAILEGIAFELRLHFEGVESAIGREIERLVVMGGGSKSDVWCQIIADVTGKLVYRSETSEATALGAGILAAVGVGWYADITQASHHMAGSARRSFTPEPGGHQVYSDLYQDVYRNLYPRISSLLDRLTEISVEI